MSHRIRCVLMRGGTSKAVVFAAQDLPAELTRRDALILGAFGSPDSRQIDGLGGADPLTSKVAIVGKSRVSGADVDYTFGQVGIHDAAINYGVDCGNTAAAVGLYAVEEGLVPPAGSNTTVRILSTNSGKLVVAEVPTEGGRARTEGTYRISGVPRPGAEIGLTFMEPAGPVTGRLLPTGRGVDEIALRGGRRVRVSVVDCGNLYGFIPATTWSLTGCELPRDIEATSRLMEEVEEVREGICRQLLSEGSALPPCSAAAVKVAVVGPRAAYVTSEGDTVEGTGIDITARIINPSKVHKAFAVTGAICVAAAAALEGTVVNELCGRPRSDGETFRIGHPQGVIEAVLGLGRAGGEVVVRSVRVGRTARRIMEGIVYVPDEAAPVHSPGRTR
jgi:2-methylaconitate cis-trans-isomerase PrpF